MPEIFLTLVNGTEYRSTYVRVASFYTPACKRCDGSGEHSYNNGTRSSQCYLCLGSGVTSTVAFTHVEATENARVLAVAKDARDTKAETKRQAKWDAGQTKRDADALEREARVEAQQAEKSKWSHLAGTVGDKVKVTGTVSIATNLDTQYGTSRLIAIDTAEKQTVKMFTTAGWCWDVSPGDTLTIQATIKDFSEWEGKAETLLLRPKSV
jgi:hypothetical protein